MNSVGLIGCGSIATISYGNILNTWFKGAERRFYDINKTAATLLSNQLSGKSVSLEELIQKSDFIIITTPPESHFELLQKAIQPGKKIICEKPFLLKSEHVLKITDLASIADAKVFAAHLRRFFPAPIMSRKFIKSGLMGQLLKIELFEGGKFSWDSKSGYHFKSALGGVLPDTGSHTLDTMLFVSGLDEQNAQFKLLDRSRVPELEPSHIFNAKFEIIADNYKIETSIQLSRRKILSNKMNLYFENGIIEVPLDMRNAVKITTPKGKTIINEEYPALNITDAFNSQFYHIIKGDGTLLESKRFLNTTAILETLLSESL